MMQSTHGQPVAEIAHLERDWAVILAGGDDTRKIDDGKIYSTAPKVMRVTVTPAMPAM
jgi:hypothetical protein